MPEKSTSVITHSSSSSGHELRSMNDLFQTRTIRLVYPNYANGMDCKQHFSKANQ